MKKKRVTGKLPASATKQSAKVRVKGKVTEPVGVTVLRDLVGVTRAADFTGISTTQFHKARREGQVSIVTEVAARGVLREMGVPLEEYGINHVAAIPLERYMLKKMTPAPAHPAPKAKVVPTLRQPATGKTMFTEETANANDQMLDALADRLLRRLKAQ